MRAELRLAGRAELAAFASRLAAVLRPGDVIILTGDLGAGKTTFTQFLARGLGVRGRVSSPTFVIAREHAPRGDGPGLIHVDAYRLDDAAEFDDLDLAADGAESVTVVEWGHGIAEELSPDRLEITLLRAFEEGGADPGVAEDDESRLLVLETTGEGWDARLESVTDADRPGDPSGTDGHPEHEERPAPGDRSGPLDHPGPAPRAAHPEEDG